MNNLDGQMTNVNGQFVAQQPQMQAQVVNQASVAQPVVGVQQTQNVQGMFTQEQLNTIISTRINPLNQKIQELTAQLAQAQQLSQSYLTELTSFKQRDVAIKAGVPAQFVDFAVFEANKLAVNGKTFEDAIKEYVASNVQLFGVAQIDGQVQQTTAPVVTPATQGVANPAQTNQVQQTVSPVAGQVVQGVQVNPTTQVVANSQPAVTAQGLPSTQPVVGVQPVANTQPVIPVQYGATSVQTAGNPAVANSVDSAVDAFLKERGLKK